MARSIKLYWDINNDAIDEAIRKFDALQKKVEEFDKQADSLANAFKKITKEQAESLELEYRRLKVEEKQLEIETKKLNVLQKQEKTKSSISKQQQSLQNQEQKELDRKIKAEEKLANDKFKNEERLRNLRQKEDSRREKFEQQQRDKERKHFEDMLRQREKLNQTRGGGGGGITPPILPSGGSGGGALGGMIGSIGGYTAMIQTAAQATLALADAVGKVYSSVLQAAMETERLETNLALAYQSANVGGKGYEENLKLAQSAMLRLQEIAAQTPFDVNQLTDAYIKLTKRGMRPAEDQLIAIGNIASFSGKSIDQLVEAILDAQQGNKVRLKEFGIDMQVESGKVKLAIGDIKVEGEKIIETFSKLGEMPGINEAMIKQSQTLEGVFNTLKDTFEQFLSSVGKSPALLGSVKTAAGPISVIFEGLKKAGGEFGKALGEPLKILTNALFPSVKKDGKEVSNEIDKWAIFFTNVANVIKSFLVPIAQFFATVWEQINTKILQNTELMRLVQKYWNYLGALWDKVSVILSNLFTSFINIVTGLAKTATEAEKTNGVFSNTLALLLTMVDVLVDATELIKDLTSQIYKWGKATSSFLVGGFFNPNTWKNLKDAIQSTNISGAFEKFDKSIRDFDKKFKQNLAIVNKEWAKVAPKTETGTLPGGADLAPSSDTKAKKDALVREKEHLQKIEKERKRHADAVIAIEKEAYDNRLFNETKTRMLAEETILHEENMFKEKEKFAKDEYELKRRLTIANVKNGKQEAIDLEFLDEQYKHEKEKREFEHDIKITELTHKHYQSVLSEQLAFVKFSRKIEENRIQDSLTALKLSLEKERTAIQRNAELIYEQTNITNLKNIEVDKKQANAEYEANKLLLENKLFDNRLYNNLSREEELEVKRQLENLEREHQAKMLGFISKGEKERLALTRFRQEKELNFAKIRADEIKNSLEAGGGNVGGSIGGLLSLGVDIKAIKSEAEKEISTLRSIGETWATNLADALQDKLERDIKKMKVERIASVISNIVSGVTDTLNKIQEIRIANIDNQIQKNNEEIEQLREKAELEKERNEELLRRQEIDNKLAKQRIEELTALQTSIPESEKGLAQEQIEIQKKRIKDIEKAKEDADTKEQTRIKQIEAENKRLEEEKRKVQREQFEINRAAQISQLTIQGIVAAINVFSSLAAIPFVGPGLAAAAAAGVGVLTATNIALIAAEPNPYAKGTLNVDGGEEGKDSVHALLMPGEAVIPVRENKDYHDVIKTIYNREIAPAELNALVKNHKMRKLNLEGLNGGSTYIVNNLDADKIIKAIKEKPTASINIDEDGLNLFIEKGGDKTKILNKKLRIKT